MRTIQGRQFVAHQPRCQVLVEAAGTRANAIIVADRLSRQVGAREARRVFGMDPAA